MNKRQGYQKHPDWPEEKDCHGCRYFKINNHNEWLCCHASTRGKKIPFGYYCKYHWEPDKKS